jgi:hypothetical protein
MKVAPPYREMGPLHAQQKRGLLISIALIGIIFILGACSSEQNLQPKFKLSEDDRLYNPLPADQPALKLWITTEYLTDPREFWEGVVYATLSNPRHPQLGRLSENANFGPQLELVIGDVIFSLRLSANEEEYRLVPAVTKDSLVETFGLPTSQGLRRLSYSEFESLFSGNIQLRKSGQPNASSLILSNSLVPQGFFSVDGSSILDRFVSNCDTSELTWNGSSDGFLLMAFYDDYLQASNPRSSVFELSDTGATSGPLQSSPNLFEELFPGVDLNFNSGLADFDRSVIRNVLKRNLPLLGTSAKISIDFRLQELANYDLLYTQCF